MTRLVMALILAVIGSAITHGKPAARPNIVVILATEMRRNPPPATA